MQERENAWEQVTAGFASQLVENFGESFLNQSKSKVRQNKSKREITFDT